jgi:Cu/Ag efflux protein CusF
MKKLISLFVFAMILGAGVASFSYAAADMAAPATQTVKGDLLKIDGEFYVVKDMAGKEIRLHVDKTTTLDGAIKMGDKVEAQATEKNHALSIRHITAAGEMAAPGIQTVKGDLLKIEGEFYTVHDTAGHEVPLHVDKTTKLDGTFKTGDKVEVQATEKNHALSVRHEQPKM